MTDTVRTHTANNGGGTFTPSDLRPVNLSFGYMVGGEAPEIVLKGGTEDPDFNLAIATAQKWARGLTRDGVVAYVGTWVRDDGACVVDVSRHVNGRWRAAYLGKVRGEDAIWDCANATSIAI